MAPMPKVSALSPHHSWRAWSSPRPGAGFRPRLRRQRDRRRCRPSVLLHGAVSSFDIVGEKGKPMCGVDEEDRLDKARATATAGSRVNQPYGLQCFSRKIL